MADINLQFGSDDNLKEILRIIKEVDKIIEGIRKSGFVAEGDDKKMRDYVSTSMKIANQSEKIEKSKQRQAMQDDKAAQKLKLQSGIIGGLEAEVKKLTVAWKSANTQMEKKAAKKNLDEIKKKLTEAKNTTATWGKALGSFQFKFNALGNIAANIVSRGFRMLNNVMRQSVQIVMNFDQAQANLSAITGKTKIELKGLTAQAKQLGAQTIFTATQITNLQIELAKLGFTAEEINNSTEAVSDFAAATGADLAQAAKTAGVAIRAFGLSTYETADAVSTMAVATTKSALQFSDYETILSTVGPVARAYGFTLQDTIALLGKLRDAGFDASKAATATRNIFLNLADSNGALSKSLGKTPKNFDELIEGLIELRTKGVSLNETLQMTDKRSVAAFNQFLISAEGAKELKNSITGVKDEMQEMVDKQLDTLTGSVKLLTSAWEGFVLSLEDGDKTISKIVTGSLGIMIDALTELSNVDLMVTRTSKLTNEQISRTYDVLLNMARAKEGLKFQGVIKEFKDINFVLLKFDETVEKNFKKSMKEAGFSSREAALLWDEYLVRRKQQFDDEVKATEAYQDRLKNANNKPDSPLGKIDFKSKDFQDEDLDFEENLINFWRKDLPAAHKWGTDEMIAGSAEYAAELKKIDDQATKDALDNEQKKKDRKAELQDAIINTAFTATDSLARINQNKMNQELANEALTEEQKDAIRRKYAKKDQQIALAEVVMNTAVGMLKLWAKPGFPAAIPLMALLGAQSAMQIAAIKSQKFAEGGEIGGKPHSQGGTIIEAERGEYIVKKSAYQRNKELVNAINAEDSLRIADMMSKDKKIIITKEKDYTKKLYELLKEQPNGYETPEYYVIVKGNQVLKLRKPGKN